MTECPHEHEPTQFTAQCCWFFSDQSRFDRWLPSSSSSSPLPRVLLLFLLLLLLSGPLLSLSRGSVSPPAAFHRVLPWRSGAAVRAESSCDGGRPLKNSPPHLHPQLRRIWTLCSPFLSPLWGLFPPALFWISLGMPPDWSRSGTHPNLTGAFLTYNRRLFERCLRAKMKENWSFVLVLSQYF